jgi:hypothetical protein
MDALEAMRSRPIAAYPLDSGLLGWRVLAQEPVHADCLGFRFEAGEKRSETAIALSANRAVSATMLRASDGAAQLRRGQAARSSLR